MIIILLFLLFANLRLTNAAGWTKCITDCVDATCNQTFTTPGYNFSCLCDPHLDKIHTILQCFAATPNCTSADFTAGILGALEACGNLSPSRYA